MILLRAALICICVTASAAQPPSDFKLMDSDISPKGNFTIEHYHSSKELTQIWITQKPK